MRVLRRWQSFVSDLFGRLGSGSGDDSIRHKAEALARDVAERTAELERLCEESRAASVAKSDFVASMSHELRTPLNIILGYSDILLDADAPPDREEGAQLIRRVREAARRLLKLVDGVLDLGKLETGKVPVVTTELSLEAFIAEVQERDRIPLAPGVRFECVATTALPVIETDPAKLMIVCDNLISNAIKFTRAGTIRVAARDRPDAEVVELEVRDSGPGIEASHLATIFQPFQQVERAGDNPFGGVGLGLAIVQQYVTLLGGDIAVRSAPGEGTTFTVRLPYKPRRSLASRAA